MNAIQTAVEAPDHPVSAGSPRRRRRRFDMTPYALIAPAVVVLAGVLGYPLVRLIILSFQQWGVAQIFGTSQSAKFVGVSNYTAIFGQSFFWTTVERSIILTVAMVGGSMIVGVLIALLMERVSTWCRYLVTFALVLAWAVPTAESALVFNWMTNYNYGVVNWLLGIQPHNWYVSSTQGFLVATVLVIWGAVPMIAIMVYAALTQVPRELVEAARVDGASATQVFRGVVVPMIKPVLIIMTTLSVIWDFQVFNQIYVLRNGNPTQDYWTLGIYSYQTAYGSHQYGLASAMAVVTVVLMLGVMVFYLRQILKAGEVE